MDRNHPYNNERRITMDENRQINGTDTFEYDLEMLKYFQSEFEYRHKHFWEILIKFFILSIGVTILPIASGVFGFDLNEIPRRLLICLPILGIAISFLSNFVLWDEMKKIVAVNKAKYRINSQLLDPKYHYEFYNKDVAKPSSDSGRNAIGSKRKWLSFRLIIIVSVLEILIAVYVIVVLLSLPQIITV